MAPSKYSDAAPGLRSKGRILRPFLIPPLCLACAIAGADQSGIRLRFDSTSYSEPTSLHSLAGDWDERVGAGDRALSVSRLLLGYVGEGYSIEYVERHDTYYRFDNATARLLYLTENRAPLVPGENYRLDIEPRRSASRGLRFGLPLPAVDRLEWWVYLSLLSPTDLLDGRLAGNATALAENEYDFDFRSELVYRHDPLYGRAPGDLAGEGYALDLWLQYRLDTRWRVTLDLRDLAGELSIDDAQRTVADASSATRSFDQQGYLVYDPAVTGLEDRVDTTLGFEPQLHLGLRYRIDSAWTAEIVHHRYRSVEFQQVGLLRPTGDGESGFHLVPQTGALGFSHASGDAHVALTMDALEPREMAFFRLEFGLHFEF